MVTGTGWGRVQLEEAGVHTGGGSHCEKVPCGLVLNAGCTLASPGTLKIEQQKTIDGRTPPQANYVRLSGGGALDRSL